MSNQNSIAISDAKGHVILYINETSEGNRQNENIEKNENILKIPRWIPLPIKCFINSLSGQISVSIRNILALKKNFDK